MGEEKCVYALIGFRESQDNIGVNLSVYTNADAMLEAQRVAKEKLKGYRWHTDKLRVECNSPVDAEMVEGNVMWKFKAEEK